MKEENKIDKLFSENLGSYEKLPPEEVWASISGKIRHGKRISIFIFSLKIAAGFALLVTTGLGWYFISERNQPIEIAEVGVLQEGELEQAGKTTDLQPAEIEPHTRNVNNAEIEKKEKTLAIQYPSEKTGIKHPGKLATIESYNNPEISNHSVLTSEVLHSGIINYPNQITPPRSINDKIKTRETQKEVSWEMLTADISGFEETEGGDQKPWQLSAMAAPEYSYRTVKNGVMAPAGYFDNSENAMLSYSGGMQVGYQVNKRLNLHAGLAFSRSGIEINNLNTNIAIEFEEYTRPGTPNQVKSVVNIGNSLGSINPNNSNLSYRSYNNEAAGFYDNISAGGEVITTNPADFSRIGADMIQYIDFIELPFNLSYRVIEGKINMSFLGGLSSNILIGNKVFIKSDGKKIESGKTENLRSVNYSGNLGLSFDYELSEQFLILLEPRYKYYLHSINQDGLIDARPFLFGIFTGLRYRF